MFLATTTITIQAADGALAFTFSPGLPPDNYAAMIDLLNHQQASCDYLRVILAGIADSWGVQCTCECTSNGHATGEAAGDDQSQADVPQHVSG